MSHVPQTDSAGSSGGASSCATTVPAAASQAPHVARLKLRCRRCGHFRNPDEFILGNVIGYCLHCYERHSEALDVLAGGIPKGCAECGRNFAELQDASGNARVFLHFFEGCYGLLCASCSDGYELKRADLYGSTPYGNCKHIRGAK